MDERLSTHARSVDILVANRGTVAAPVGDLLSATDLLTYWVASGRPTSDKDVDALDLTARRAYDAVLSLEAIFISLASVIRETREPPTRATAIEPNLALN